VIASTIKTEISLIPDLLLFHFSNNLSLFCRILPRTITISNFLNLYVQVNLFFLIKFDTGKSSPSHIINSISLHILYGCLTLVISLLFVFSGENYFNRLVFSCPVGTSIRHCPIIVFSESLNSRFLSPSNIKFICAQFKDINFFSRSVLNYCRDISLSKSTSRPLSISINTGVSVS
jgi:hypothetical protein